MLEQENPLPRAELHLTINDWNHFARARQHHADVRRAVVRAFIIVLIVGVLGHELFEKSLQIPPGRRSGVFHDDETATGVTRKHRHGPSFDFTLRDSFSDLVSNLVSSFPARLDVETFRVRAHLSPQPTIRTLSRNRESILRQQRRAPMLERITGGQFPPSKKSDATGP